MNEEDSHIENVYAFDENFKEIYIGDVAYIDRGIKKKYFCLGCKRQMQAVKPQTNRKAHFRHHVKPNSTESKCSYRDETHRHYLAKANAIDLKKIKVPAVYKYPPNKDEDKVLLLKDAEFVDAHTVLNEHYIYENENGEIKVSATFNEKEDKYLFIKPDSIFLDKEGKPILIIEFVATHKPDQSKLMKLKRLGINAIQVNVPKSSPEEIRDLFFKTNRTKWLYNHAESETDYLRLSNSYSGGVFEIDNEQRRLFEEGYNCRKAQLGDFIRTIGRILESEHYREVEQNVKSEIRRLEENTSGIRERLDNIREGYIREGIDIHCERRETLKRAEEEFSKYSSALEKRYLTKREGLEFEKNPIERSIAEIQFSIQKINLTRPTTSSDVEAARATSETIRREIEVLESRERKNSELEREIFERTRDEIESETERIERQIDTLSEYFGREDEKSEIDFDKLRNAEEKEIQRIEIEQERIADSIRTESADIQSRIESNNKGVFQELEKGPDSSNGRIAEEYRGIHNFRESIIEYKKALEILERIEAFIRK